MLLSLPVFVISSDVCPKSSLRGQSAGSFKSSSLSLDQQQLDMSFLKEKLQSRDKPLLNTETICTGEHEMLLETPLFGFVYARQSSIQTK